MQILKSKTFIGIVIFITGSVIWILSGVNSSTENSNENENPTTVINENVNTRLFEDYVSNTNNISKNGEIKYLQLCKYLNEFDEPKISFNRELKDVTERGIMKISNNCDKLNTYFISNDNDFYMDKYDLEVVNDKLKLISEKGVQNTFTIYKTDYCLVIINDNYKNLKGIGNKIQKETYKDYRNFELGFIVYPYESNPLFLDATKNEIESFILNIIST